MDRLVPAIFNRALEDAGAWFGQNMENIGDDYYSLYREQDGRLSANATGRQEAEHELQNHRRLGKHEYR